MIGWRRHLRQPREAILAARIAGAVPIIWFGLHLVPLLTALAWITPRRSSRRPLDTGRVLSMTDAVLDRRPFGIRPTCLLRSLVLYRFLRENGASARLHLGIAMEGRALIGHAWLTLDGHLLLESSDPLERFTQVLSHP